MKWIKLCLILLIASCTCPENPMPETADILVIDGEDAGSTPWEFDSITEEGDCDFSLQAAAALHGANGYRYTGSLSYDYGFGSIAIASQTTLYGRFYIKINSLTTEADKYGRFIAIKDGELVKFSIGMIRVTNE